MNSLSGIIIILILLYFQFISYTMIALEFKNDDLKYATNNFLDSQKLASGGFGTVFKGFLNGSFVAVKVFSAVRSQHDTEHILFKGV